jgi:hypothetical protein
MQKFPSLKSLTAKIAVAAVGLALAPAPNLFAGAGFNNADLKGDFSVMFGTNLPFVTFKVGVFSADGHGSCTWNTPPVFAACSYNVAANGIVSISGSGPGFPQDSVTLVLSNNNANLEGFELGINTTKVILVKQSAPASGFNNADLKGSYSWKSPFDVFNVNFPSASLFTADGAGNCSLLDFYFLPTFTSFAPGFTCSYTVQPNGVVILTTNSGVPFTFVLNNKGAGATGIYGAVGPGQDGSKFITLTKQ